MHNINFAQKKSGVFNDCWLQNSYINSETTDKNNIFQKVITKTPENTPFVTQGYSNLIREGDRIVAFCRVATIDSVVG